MLVIFWNIINSVLIAAPFSSHPVMEQTVSKPHDCLQVQKALLEPHTLGTDLCHLGWLNAPAIYNLLPTHLDRQQGSFFNKFLKFFFIM